MKWNLEILNSMTNRRKEDMKKNIILSVVASAFVLFASCQKSPVNSINEVGYLSFSEFSLDIDEEVDTRAAAANGNYIISIYNADEDLVIQKSYNEVKNNGNKLTLLAGSYTLVASSSADDVPVAAFEQPIYGVTKNFTIEAGMETRIGELTCGLVQCKVTVSYSDDFLAAVTGPCSTKVELTAGSPLEFALNADKTYDQSAGYFAVNGNTMTVVFKGSINGQTKTQTKTFANVAAKQWRQVRFIQKVNEQGEATFDILIQDLVSDETLNNDLEVKEEIIGEDPDAPKGDGGIMLSLDYEGGCDLEITDLQNMLIVPLEERDMQIRFKATVPGGVKKFTVDISSTNTAFIAAVTAADAISLDLISPSAANEIIFDVVPFPHGNELLGQTDIAFNLDTAQDAIINYKGVHTFTMNIVDNEGCKNQIPVKMIVE
ncbi:MAG: DUF4493 domain-containing protein [Bacteroidales bacterium]|nr:DUF4493 domain-containing protein [Bacteroidales bacterium]